MTQYLFKICKRCGVEGEHYRGVSGRCANCHKAGMRELRLTDPSYQERDRARAKLPNRKEAAAKITKRWREQHPEAYRAQTKVGNSLRDGKIKKSPCVICGTRDNVHAHHHDYSKPLDVRWLCAKCHHRIHSAFPELGGHYATG